MQRMEALEKKRREEEAKKLEQERIRIEEERFVTPFAKLSLKIW